MPITTISRSKEKQQETGVMIVMVADNQCIISRNKIDRKVLKIMLAYTAAYNN
ncbi:hypothetical protein [Hymenobacter sublimis]|uniref:Transposase n=1 Tax=Hymenobacter sublimis TaxID=2933777 RepID=A0ABY4JFL0_9BACT|nr:hypothetical protein [Hymenobacter sublimis]UPL50546.1 hypothetical protein MWH26_06465 [Hymenobacter sublimis]